MRDIFTKIRCVPSQFTVRHGTTGGGVLRPTYAGRILLKHVFGFFKQIPKDVAAVFVHALFFEAFEFLEEFFLFGADVCRSYYFDNNVLVATSSAVDDRNAKIFQTEAAARLGAGRDTQNAGFTIDSWHFDLGAKGSLGEADRQLVDDVVGLPFEEGVLLDGQDNVQVAGGAATSTHFAFAGDTDVDTIVD